MMSQVEIKCTRCQASFKEEEASVYECPKCGTTIMPESDASDQEKTQIFNV